MKKNLGVAAVTAILVLGVQSLYQRWQAPPPPPPVSAALPEAAPAPAPLPAKSKLSLKSLYTRAGLRFKTHNARALKEQEAAAAALSVKEPQEYPLVPAFSRVLRELRDKDNLADYLEAQPEKRFLFCNGKEYCYLGVRLPSTTSVWLRHRQGKSAPKGSLPAIGFDRFHEDVREQPRMAHELLGDERPYDPDGHIEGVSQSMLFDCTGPLSAEHLRRFNFLIIANPAPRHDPENDYVLAYAPAIANAKTPEEVASAVLTLEQAGLAVKAVVEGRVAERAPDGGRRAL